MRIETYNQVAGLYKLNKPTKATNTQGVQVSRDQVQISQVGKDYQIAKQAVADASDVREDKVADLKARIAAGTYNVSADDFASKLLEKYNALSF